MHSSPVGSCSAEERTSRSESLDNKESGGLPVMTSVLEPVPYEPLEDRKAAGDSYVLGRSEPWKLVFRGPSFSSVQGVFDVKAVLENRNEIQLKTGLVNSLRDCLHAAVSEFCPASVPVWDAQKYLGMGCHIGDMARSCSLTYSAISSIASQNSAVSGPWRRNLEEILLSWRLLQAKVCNILVALMTL